MATKACKDCGEPVSPTAYQCPQCKRMMYNGVLNKLMGSEIILVMLFLIYFRFLTN